MNSVLRRRLFKTLSNTTASPFSTGRGGPLSVGLDNNPLKNAIRFENQNRTWTYKEIEAHSDAFAYGLLELGYKKGDRLVLWVDRAFTSEITIAQLGSVKAGVSIVPLLSSDAKAFESAVQDSEAKGVIFSGNTKAGQGKRIDIVQQSCPELETALPGTLPSFSRFSKLKHLINTSFNSNPGTFKYRQLLVYGNPKFQTNTLPTDIDTGAPVIYAESNGRYKEYTLNDIRSFAEKFRSENQVGENDAITVSGNPLTPGTFAAGAYQSVAYGNYVTLTGNESFKAVADKIRVQQPSVLIINENFTNEDLKSAQEGGYDSLKRVLVAGESGSYQSLFGGKNVSSIKTHWD